MAGNFKMPWREAATLFLIARSHAKETVKHQFDYKLLLLQRHANSKFMPNFYVTPGGVIDKSDFSNKWMDLYKQTFRRLGIDFSKLLNIKGPRPDIFRQSDTALPREIAFRICAIRETFEEAGVLLLRKSSPRNKEESQRDGTDDLSEEEIYKWRKIVHNDASQFITLCRELDSVPDVWELSEWSNWLNPAFMKHRYDTAFFTAFTDHVPKAQHDESEMVETKFLSPPDILHNSFMARRRLKVGFTQLYELLRMCRFQKWQDLKNFQESRSHLGCSRWIPIQTKCRDATINFLPGDDMYDTAYNYQQAAKNTCNQQWDNIQELDQGFEELEDGMKNLNRAVKIPKKPPLLRCRYQPTNGHYLPVTDTGEIISIIGSHGD